jgi:hypothetical protein
MLALLRGMFTQPITAGRRLVVLAAFALAALSVSAPAHAQQPTFGDALDFAGTWKNVNSGTNNLTKIKVSPSAGIPPVKVRAWARCHPSDCDWGTVSGYNGPAGAHKVIAHFAAKNNLGFVFAKRELTLKLRTDGDVDYRVETDFADPFREDYVVSGRLTRLS